MPSRKTVKLVLYEVLQFAALGVPIFVVMERFAGLMRDVREGDLTAYWLVVAASVAYVTSVTLLVWVPVKYLTLKKRRCIAKASQWRPTALAYVILCTLPCFAILIASSKVQTDRGSKLDHFTELPVSLVLFCLICVDVIERIRPCSLTGRDILDADLDLSGPILTHLEQVTTVSGQLYADGARNGSPAGHPETRNGSSPRRWHDRAHSHNHSSMPSPAYLYSSSSRTRSYSGPLRLLWARDFRSEAFVDSFLFWLDTVEMVRAAGDPSIYYSNWIFPVFILAFLSTLRLAITPLNPLLSSAGFVVQDLPFSVVRIALIVVFGYVTPVLYAMKNILVCLTFVYFTFLTKLKIFRRQRMF
ncbi:transmembrane protein 236 isoform X2 [Lampris incognitus]|uniref:transmembrane protein 236 isoform X2 n=1 Tax=Lampris incognitus TaxID=2546036 RepID=UPI0024B52DEC|nr:transmembrane protein 236 isoform X2 [Lampris incognitus]